MYGESMLLLLNSNSYSLWHIPQVEVVSKVSKLPSVSIYSFLIHLYLAEDFYKRVEKVALTDSWVISR